MPRWDIQKLKSAERNIGTEMKSVGEVMAIGRSFPEALQKAVRMLNIGADGIGSYPAEISHPEKEIEKATDRRLFALGQFFRQGGTIESAAQLSHIDRWFLAHIQEIVGFEAIIHAAPIEAPLLRKAKEWGFSDRQIAKLQGIKEEEVRRKRIAAGIVPVVKQIDTLAGEFAAETNYLYMTYHGTHSDVVPSTIPAVMVLGSGPYCIGSSVEFDWCAVNTVKTLRKLGEQSIMINSNPETVSTDYDESNRLYFEELTLERVRDVADFEHPKGLIVSVGGQIANNLALPLSEAGYPILGTAAASIDIAENRQKFSLLLNQLNIDQPQWEAASSLEKAKLFAVRVGYPVLVRPSYVLSGAAMNVVANEHELSKYLHDAAVISADKPVVISQFINNAKELEIDGVAGQGEILIEAISEHIENAGIHSGDATIVLPPQRLYLETIRRTKKMTREIVKALNITGPFNIQFIAIDNAIKVIECNVRASRSFPFVSKVTNHNLIEIATEAVLGRLLKASYETLELDYVAVKSPQFSYQRLKGANPVAHVEMASTGEVACLGDQLLDAFFMSWLSTEQSVRGNKILVSIGGDKKAKLLSLLQKLDEKGWEFFATENTHDFLSRQGVASTFLYKASQQLEPNVVTHILRKDVDLIINIPRTASSHPQITDGFKIRRLAIDHHIPLITNFHQAQLFLQCLLEVNPAQVPIKSLKEYTAKNEFNALPC